MTERILHNMGQASHSDLKIDISEAGISLNDTILNLPVAIEALISILGSNFRHSKKKYNEIFTWGNLGIYAYSNNGKAAKSLSIFVDEKKKYEFHPEKNFPGSLTVDGLDYKTIPVAKKKKNDDHFKLKLGDHELFISLDDHNTISEIELNPYEAPAPLPNPDKYKLVPIDGEKIEFEDFNFKLCVIQVLMYEKELLKPKFDVYEFVERYKEREIDIDEEGYAIIPEVREYFEKLEIGKKYINEITGIYQDGGNDIYLQLFPFWSGETDEFNIRSFEDVDQFKNLKKITLFYDKNEKEIQKTLAAKGIEVD